MLERDDQPTQDLGGRLEERLGLRVVDVPHILSSVIGHFAQHGLDLHRVLAGIAFRRRLSIGHRHCSSVGITASAIPLGGRQEPCAPRREEQGMRQDGGMTEDEARRRLATARVGRLASVDRNGRPHVVPICFAVSGDRVVSVVDQKPKQTLQLRRLENIRRSPDVQLVVDHYDDDWSALWWVRISGRGRVIDGGITRDEAIDLLAGKYPQYRDHRPIGPALVIDVNQIRGWQATID
jgi:PPOX class probable F420-dependent enzyme